MSILRRSITLTSAVPRNARALRLVVVLLAAIVTCYGLAKWTGPMRVGGVVACSSIISFATFVVLGMSFRFYDLRYLGWRAFIVGVPARRPMHRGFAIAYPFRVALLGFLVRPHDPRGTLPWDFPQDR